MIKILGFGAQVEIIINNLKIININIIIYQMLMEFKGKN
jgi:hypothetical protein